MSKHAEKIPFWQDNALFASKANINVFFNFFKQNDPSKVLAVKKKISKTFDFSL